MAHSTIPYPVSDLTTSRPARSGIVPNAMMLKSVFAPQRLFQASELLFPQNDNFADDGPDERAARPGLPRS